MSSGRLTLALQGIQDQFLTGDPQVSYFLKRFTRQTIFALEVLNNSFDSGSNWGDLLKCEIPRKGQLIKTIYFRVQLPALTTAADNIGYTDSVASVMIEYADLFIGGQLIERINGEYITLFNQLFIPDSQFTSLFWTQGVASNGLRCPLGRATSVPASALIETFPKEFLVALPFYFIYSDPLSIPLVSLTKQEVEVHIKLRPLDQLTVNSVGNTALPTPSGGTVVDNPPIKLLSLPVEYVFLGDDEISQFQNSQFDYVITQLQMKETFIPVNTSSINMRLEFINPVKEMFFVVQNESNVMPATTTRGGNWWTNTSNPEQEQSPLFSQITSAQLTFNNEVRFSSEVADSLFLNYIQPLNNHTRCPTNSTITPQDNRIKIYNYSFALDPENDLPTGQVNMSRIVNKNLTVNLTDSTATDGRKLRVYAKSYNILRIANGLGGLLFMENNYF
jgi:hypothetical protein